MNELLSFAGFLYSWWMESDFKVALLLTFQIVVATLLTVVAVRLLPQQNQRQDRMVALYFFVCSLFIPFGALLIALPGIWIAHYYPIKQEQKGVGEVDLPEFVPQLVSRVKYGVGARYAAQLGKADASISERLTALASMQAREARAVGPILRGLLSDSMEDVRLLVYAMLDGAEKEITRQTQLIRLSEAQATSPKDRFNFAKQLAELYWELIYQNLVQDDIYRYMAEQAEKYAEIALGIDSLDAGLWYMRARLALLRRDSDATEIYLQRAAEQNFPQERLLPWQAELAYLRGDHDQVRTLFQQFPHQSTLPFLKPLQRYWLS